MWLTRWLSECWANFRRKTDIPAPPWRASKRTATIMYGVWYGRFTPDQARKKAKDWGFSPESVEDMISQATQWPSYWSRQNEVETDT